MSVLNWNNPVTISGFNASDPHVIIDSNGNSTAVWVEQSIYNIGEIAQSDTSIIGSGTIFTSSMVGGTITYENGITVPITSFVNETSLTTTTSLTMTNQSYTINYNGIIITRTLSNSNELGNAIQLSTEGNNAVKPNICIDGNGNISIVWVENNNIYYASNNGTWSFAILLSDGNGSQCPVIKVDNDGNIVVCWVKTGQIEVVTKPITTGIWSSITTFIPTNSDSPNVAISGGIITLVWHAKPDIQDQILASTAKIVDGIFNTPVNIVGENNVNRNHSLPVVAVDPNGNSLVAWCGSCFNDYADVLSTSLVAGASSWSSPLKISSAEMTNPPDVIISILIDIIGNSYILWTSSTDKNHYNIKCSSRQLGKNFDPEFQIVNDDSIVKDANMSINSLSGLLITYMYYNGVNSTIQTIETNVNEASSNIYTSPSTISMENTNNSHPCGSLILIGEQINAVVVWQSYDSINNTTSIQLATGSKLSLVPPTNLTVNQTVNNFGIFIKYDNILDWIASTDPNTIGYSIYRNNVFIGQVDLTTTTFVDYNRILQDNSVYSVVSLDKNFQQSKRIQGSII